MLSHQRKKRQSKPCITGNTYIHYISGLRCYLSCTPVMYWNPSSIHLHKSSLAQSSKTAFFLTLRSSCWKCYWHCHTRFYLISLRKVLSYHIPNKLMCACCKVSNNELGLKIDLFLARIKPGRYSAGKGIPLLGRHRETHTLTGAKTKKSVSLLAHSWGRNPYPYCHRNLPYVAQLEEN